MNAFELFGTIAINNSKANSALDETGSKAQKLASTFGDAFNKCGSFALTIGKTIAAGLAAGTAAMTGLTVKALGLSGELEQNLGGSEAVYKEYASKMQAYATEAFTNMGLSQSNYLATANKMGALFQGIGFSIEESSDITAKAMQRAADVASIMGIDVAWAMDSIAGAAKGNFTMMDNLGVAINETALANYALEKGITKSTAKMSTQEKVALAMELFMERTAYATGNYAKENETLAGALTTAKAALDNFLTGSGDLEMLADAFVNASEVIIKNVNSLLPKLIGGINQLVDRLLPYIPTVLQSLLPGIIEGAVNLISGLAMALPGIAQVLVDQVPLIVSQLNTAFQNTFPVLVDSIKSMIEQIDFNALGETIGASFVDLVNRIPELLRNVGNAISYGWDTIVWPMIQGLFKAVFNVELPDWGSIGQSIEDGWTLVIWPAIMDFFKSRFEVEIPPWEETKSAIEEWWTNSSSPTLANIKAFAADVVNAFAAVANWVTGDGASLIITLGAIALGFGLVSGAINVMFSPITLLIGLTALLIANWEDVKKVVNAAFDAIVSWLETNLGVPLETFRQNVIVPLLERWDEVKGAILNAAIQVGDFLGIDLVAGWDTVTNAIASAWNAVTGAIQSATRAVEKFLGLEGNTGLGGGDARPWYVKDNPSKYPLQSNAKGAVFSKSTIFDTRLGFQEVGEAGPEAVAPISVLQSYVSDAVAKQNAGLVNALDRVVESIESMNENMGSNLRAALDDTSLKINNREFGRLVRTVT